MKENAIELKSINDILSDSFFVAHYQRGYRWNKQQVNDLLNDIWEFSQKERKKDEFYCLQPIVVKKVNDKWELIDGQQRLTTIYIILRYFNKVSFPEPKPIFSINFKTRPDSESFLEELDENKKNNNIDFFHIFSAFEVIEKWFNSKKKKGQNTIDYDFYRILLNETKIIWYQVNDDSDSIEIFTRINIGKIPLTNAELIKALFLGSNNFGSDKEIINFKQLEIASEWDRIEYSLQNEEFWYFINKFDNNLPTRIEFIFDFMADNKNKNDDYFTFRYFNDQFKQGSSEKIWKKIKGYFMTFDEWFNNRELYHLVGYLITQGCKIQDIIDHSKNKTKTEFKDYLNQEIKNQVKCKIDDLDYDDNNDRTTIEKVLLLFNIESMIRNSKENSRFPFDKYKRDKWSLEHIHARNSKTLKTSEMRKSWLLEIRGHLVDKDGMKNEKNELISLAQFIQSIDKLTKQEKIDLKDFEDIQTEIFNGFGDEPNLHLISNLALLSGKDNSALNNSIFPVKRSKIVELDKEGSFIPICTRNVFLKYYTKDVSQPYYWGKKDRNCYIKAIKTILVNYLPTQIDEDIADENN